MNQRTKKNAVMMTKGFLWPGKHTVVTKKEGLTITKLFYVTFKTFHEWNFNRIVAQRIHTLAK